MSFGFLSELQYATHSAEDFNPSFRTKARASSKGRQAGKTHAHFQASRSCQPIHWRHKQLQEYAEYHLAFCQSDGKRANPQRISVRAFARRPALLRMNASRREQCRCQANRS